jgi:hypothetical protein
MKKIAFLPLMLLMVVTAAAQLQQHRLIKKWQTDTLLKVPESVYFDAGQQLLYVSNIDGAPDGMDGKGSIGKVGLDGKIIQVDWVTGLNAPKGMGIFHDRLYVADLDAVAVIDVKAGKLIKRIPVEGAIFLNDITIDNNGIVYVSDTRNKKLFRLEKEVPALFIDHLQSPNGLLFHHDTLYVLDNGSMFKVEKDRTLTRIADGMEAQTDGIEHVTGNDFIVSCWPGVIYYIRADGTKEKLLDTTGDKSNTADIGYDAKTRMVYVPTFFKNSIVAYQLQ